MNVVIWLRPVMSHHVRARGGNWGGIKLHTWQLGAFSADSARQLDVFWHNGDALGVNGAQVGIFEKSDQVGLGGFLKKNDKKK